MLLEQTTCKLDVEPLDHSTAKVRSASLRDSQPRTCCVACERGRMTSMR